MEHSFKKTAIAILSFAFMGHAWAAVTVYVPVGSANEVLVIDGEQDRVIGSMGEVVNAHGLAATNNGDYLVVGSMSLAPKAQDKPEGMSEDEHSAHHADAKGQPAVPDDGASYITLIDARSQRVLQRFDVDGISHHSAITPDGRYAISTHTTTGSISIIDLVDRKLVRTLATGPVPNYALVSTDGKTVYVSNSGNNTVSEIDTSQWALRRNIMVGVTPEHMAFSADQKTLYVINVGDNSVSAISLAQGEVTNTYPVGSGPHGIDISDDGKMLYVSSKKSDQLTVIEIASGTSLSKVLGPMPYHIKSIKGTGKLYVSSRAQPWIWVVDQQSLEVIRKIPIKGEGHQMAVVQN